MSLVVWNFGLLFILRSSNICSGCKGVCVLLLIVTTAKHRAGVRGLSHLYALLHSTIWYTVTLSHCTRPLPTHSLQCLLAQATCSLILSTRTLWINMQHCKLYRHSWASAMAARCISVTFNALDCDQIGLSNTWDCGPNDFQRAIHCRSLHCGAPSYTRCVHSGCASRQRASSS